jgi:predicted permease
VQFVSPDYFKTMRIPLLKGRWFTAADRKGTSKVVVINETAARRFWPGEDPVGRPIGVGQGGFGDRAEIIGVVGDVRYGQMDEPPQPDVYISHLQASRGSMVLFARTVGNPAAMTQAMEHEVHALNQDLPVFDVKTMNERIRDATSRARFSAILLAVFAAIALILAAVGIYGVMSYLVTQRTREIGIRIALGAGSAEVLALVVRRGAVLAAAGIGVGVFGALVTTRVLATLLYEVKPGDPATYVTISAVLAVVALVASYIPARRASSVDPSSALRAD